MQLRRLQNIKMLFSFLLTVFASSAGAQTYELGEPVYHGNGCPHQGSLVATISPDGQAISFLFDQFIIRVLPEQKVIRNVTCKIRIPMKVTPGYVAEASFVEYRGFVSVGNRSSVSLSGYGSAGPQRGNFPVAVSFSGPKTDNFYVLQRIQQNAKLQKCSSQNEVQLTLTARFGGFGIGEFQLDSGDIGSDGIRMGITLRPCQN